MPETRILIFQQQPRLFSFTKCKLSNESGRLVNPKISYHSFHAGDCDSEFMALTNKVLAKNSQWYDVPASGW
jgi:hypothetical protein